MNGLKVSEVQVLHSNAGYYIGTLYWDDQIQAWLPYERLSEWYYDTKEEAELALPSYKD